jgi:hypothetical protein
MAGTKVQKPLPLQGMSVGFLDESGIGSGPFDALHALVDVDGNIVNPASDGTLQTGLSALIAGLSTIATRMGISVVSPIAGQIAILGTNTAVQLPPFPLVNGLVIKAQTTNAANGFVGATGVTTVDDGTGNGFRLLPGESMSFAVSNSAFLWINGQSGDVFYFGGN